MNLHAIEQTQLRRQHRVDGVGRPKFDFHTDRAPPRFFPKSASLTFRTSRTHALAVSRKALYRVVAAKAAGTVRRRCAYRSVCMKGPSSPWTCVEIKILRRVRAESSRLPPRRRRDACSMAWRCRFFTARPSQDGRVHPTHWLISTQYTTYDYKP